MKNFLRQIVVLLMCSIMSFSAVACKSNKSKGSSISSSSQSTISSSSIGSTGGTNSSVEDSNISSGTSSSSSSSSSSGTQGGQNADVSEYVINKSDIPLKLQYDEPAPILSTENCPIGKSASDVGSTADDSWEEWSLPIGNGYFGANVFGRTESERIQISEKTLSNPNEYIEDNSYGGLNSFSETYIDFNHIRRKKL